MHARTSNVDQMIFEVCSEMFSRCSSHRFEKTSFFFIISTHHHQVIYLTTNSRKNLFIIIPTIKKIPRQKFISNIMLRMLRTPPRMLRTPPRMPPHFSNFPHLHYHPPSPQKRENHLPSMTFWGADWGQNQRLLHRLDLLPNVAFFLAFLLLAEQATWGLWLSILPQDQGWAETSHLEWYWCFFAALLAAWFGPFQPCGQLPPLHGFHLAPCAIVSWTAHRLASFQWPVLFQICWSMLAPHLPWWAPNYLIQLVEFNIKKGYW